MKKKRDWMTLAEAARQLGVSRQRMHQIVTEMKIKKTSVNPRLVVISRSDLDRIEKKRQAE